MSVVCRLCKSNDCREVDRYSLATLEDVYRAYFGIDLRECVTSVLPSEVALWSCRECRVEFFSPFMDTKDSFYESLGSNEKDYYVQDKWEFEEAIQQISEGDRVLEVGSGKGYFLEAVTKKSKTEPVGIEFNPEGIASAKQRGVTLIDVSLNKLAETQKETFDVVCSFQVIEHLEDPGDFFSSAAYCLKSHGKLIVSVPNRDSFFRLTANNVLDFPPHHITRWNEQVFQLVAKRFGLEVVEVHFEPLAKYHHQIFKQTMIYQRLLNLFNLAFRPLENIRHPIRRSLMSISFLLSHALRINWFKIEGAVGHTILIVLKKTM